MLLKLLANIQAFRKKVYGELKGCQIKFVLTILITCNILFVIAPNHDELFAIDFASTSLCTHTCLVYPIQFIEFLVVPDLFTKLRVIT